MANGFSAALLECSRQGCVEIQNPTGKPGASEFILTEKGKQLLLVDPAELKIGKRAVAI
ncbi:MAG: hypothetical protein IPP40_14815 [bacterium]|nr:hypothetical protein [bacterium]